MSEQRYIRSLVVVAPPALCACRKKTGENVKGQGALCKVWSASSFLDTLLNRAP